MIVSQQWWNSRQQLRVNAQEEYAQARQQQFSELDSFFVSHHNSAVSRINRCILDATIENDKQKLAEIDKRREEDTTIKDLEEEINDLKEEAEDIQMLLTEEEDLKKELESKRQEVLDEQKELDDKIDKLRLENSELEEKISKDKEKLEASVQELEKQSSKKNELSVKAKESEQELEKAVTEKKAELEKPKAEAESESKSTKSKSSKSKSAEPKLAETSKPAEQKPEEKAKSSVPAPAPAPATKPVSITSKSAAEEFAENEKRIAWIKHNVKEAAQQVPPEVKRFITDAKLNLRPKFGMLTNSVKQLISCRNSVKELFLQAKQKNVPIVYDYLLNLYSKMLVEQSESEANQKLQNALPLAMLTILLWSEFPELGDYVIPRFIKNCPQLIGFYCPVDTEGGRKRMSWKRDPTTKRYESEEDYMGRLSGICAVWACMTQSKLSKGQVHPYNMSHSWKFMARMLNKPKKDVTQVDHCLVAAWWDMTALRFSEAFGKQGIKILDLAWDKWTEGFNESPSLRLRCLGENWKETGVIEHAWKPLV